jgi:ABC-type nickel/cobalt efflux system permease component RcnA
MNLLLGIVVGIVLTIGTAFMADAFATSNMTADDCSKQIVNWEVAKERLHETTASIATEWSRLKSGKL